MALRGQTSLVIIMQINNNSLDQLVCEGIKSELKQRVYDDILNELVEQFKKDIEPVLMERFEKITIESVQSVLDVYKDTTELQVLLKGVDNE